MGDITDSSGAIAPNVSVTVIHEGTRTERKVQTNEAGQYRVTPLNPGTYTIQVESAGFKKEVRTGVVLEVSAVLEVDFTLQVGELTETIEVTGVTPTLRTEEASVGRVVTSSELERMPVNQRNFTALILMMPGTSSISRSQNQGVAQSGTALYSVNGGRPQDNNFTLDGVDSNMQMMNSPGISPPMDAIQEFKVATNTGSEFGRSMGANVSMVMKSGTRDLHGTLYEYLRNDKLDANEFFANRNGTGKVPFRLNQYGVAVGGPVLLPKADLRDKMFWFFSWEGFRRRRGNTLLGNSPPADLRRGDFSSLLTQASPIYLRDPLLTGNCTAADRTACFPGNIIPTSRINKAIPTALEIMVPLPNRPGQVQNLVSNVSQANDRDSFHVRWDYNLNSTNSFFFRYSRQDATLINPNAIIGVSDVSRFDVVNTGASWVHIFSPASTLEVGFGTNQPDGGSLGEKPISRAEYFSRTGIQMYQAEVFSDPLVNITLGAYSIPSASGGLQGDNIWQWRGNMSLIRGKHSLKFGGQYHYRNFYTNTANPMNGDAIFNGQITNFPMADALLGYPSEVRRGSGNTLTDSISHYYLAHIQDDWRVSSNLTVNLGLTYQMSTRPYDKTDRLGNLWVHKDPASGKVIGDLMWATTNPEPDPKTGQAQLTGQHLWFRSGTGPKRLQRLWPASWHRLQAGFKDRYSFRLRYVLQLHLRAGAAGPAEVLALHGSASLQSEPRRARLVDHRRGSEFSEYLRHRRLASESGESVTVHHAVEPFHSTRADEQSVAGHRLRGLRQPQADRLFALQYRGDSWPRGHRAPPSATGIWRSRRRL